MNLMKTIVIMSILILSGCFSNTQNGINGKVEDLHLLWQYSYNLDGGAPSVLPKFIEEGLIISSGDNHITALELKSGIEVWKSSLNHHTSLTNRRFGKLNNLITGSVARRIFAWDINTGQKVWSVDIEEPMSWSNFTGLTVACEKFITYGRGGDLYIVSSDGKLETVNFEARVYDSVMKSGLLFINQARSDAAIFSAVNIENDSIIWQQIYYGFGFPAYAAPIIENDILYVGTAGGPAGSQNGFFALDAQTGQELWRREGILTYSAVLAGDRIFGVNGQRVWALDKHTGEKLWITRGRGGHSESNLDYLDGHVYWAHGGGLHVFEAETGELLHVKPSPDGSFFWRVTTGAGRVFAQSSRHLYAFAPWGHENPLE